MKAFFYLKTHFRHLMAFLCLFCLTAGSMAQTKWSEVLWCADNSTLYFIQRENNTANPGKWGSLNVDRLAVAQSVDNSGTYKPVWLEIVRPNVKRVVFDSSFANAAPFSTAYWFYDMVNLEEINGLSYLNTSRVTTMRCMFHGCSSLRGIDMSKFDTSNVTDMFGMFFNTSKVTSLNLSKFNTSKVTDMGSMFSNIAATSLDLSTFDTRNVTGMDGMFANFRGTSLDVSNFNTSKVVKMNSMFSSCHNITTLDVSNFDTGNVTNMDYMFYYSDKLTTIYCDDSWTTSSSEGMFEDCDKLKGAISYDASKIDVTYANPTTGYFTSKTFPITINSKRIPRDSASNLTVMSGLTVKNGGYAKYDDATKTLSLKNVTIEGWAPLICDVSDLTINIEGNNYIRTTSEESGDAILISGTTTITGGGYLYAGGGGNGAGIKADASLTIENAAVEVYGQSGIKGVRLVSASTGRVLGSSLTIKGSRTRLIANSNNHWNDAGPCVGPFRSIILGDGVKIRQPQDADILNGAVVDASGNRIVAKEVEISTPYNKYFIKICGVDVTEWNCDDLTSIDGVELKQPYGCAKYDPDTHHLILNNVNINSGENFGILNSAYNLTVTIKNVVNISSKNASAFYSLSSLKITGGGYLMLNSDYPTGATVYLGDELTLDHVYVTMSGAKNGLSGTIYINSDGIKIPNGSLKMQNYALLGAIGSEGSIVGLTGMTLLDGIIIKDPSGAEWNSSNLNVCQNGEVCKDLVNIGVPEENLNLWVGDLRVTTLNGPYLGLLLGGDVYKQVQDNKDYNICYNPDTKTLTMDNVSLKTDDCEAIYSSIEGLTIQVENNPCLITATGDKHNGLSLYKSATIKAVNVTPSLATLGLDLAITSDNHTAIDFLGYDASVLKVEDIKLFASGKLYGIAGINRNGQQNLLSLEVKGQDTYLISAGNTAGIYLLDALNLSDGLRIVLPEKGKFMNGCVYDLDKNDYATNVTIYRSKLKGDVNMDGTVDISDVVAVINTMAGGDTYKSTADVNEDNAVNISDVVNIIKIMTEK